MKYLVLSSKPYDFDNSKGEKVSGVKISYINRKPSARENEYGNPPMITNCSLSLVKGKRLEETPAIFDMEFEQVTGQKNKPELLLTDLEYVSPVDFGLFFDK
jgi:hypothetical protein